MKKKQQQDYRLTVIQQVQDRVAPHDTKLEQSVLGAALAMPHLLTEAVRLLSPSDFYEDKTRTAFNALQEMFNGGEHIDLLTFIDRVRGKLDLLWCNDLTANFIPEQAFVPYCHKLKELSLRRAMGALGHEMLLRGYDPNEDTASVYEHTLQTLTGLVSDGSKTTMRDRAVVVDDTISLIESARNSSGITGVPTGLDSLDRQTGGWQKQDLILIGARPGMGKSALALQFARHPAMLNIPVGFIQLEMSDTGLMLRELAMSTDIPYQQLRLGKINDTQMQRVKDAAETVKRLKIYTDTTPSLSVQLLRAKAYDLVHRRGCKLLIVDYLELIDNDRTDLNSVEAIGAKVQGLKQIARAMDIPVIVLAQLNRAVESRGGTWYEKRPQLNDFRGSGLTEAYIDVAILPMRPSYYERDAQTIPHPETGEEMKDKIILHIEKNKQGTPGDLILYCDIATNKIWNYERLKQIA